MDWLTCVFALIFAATVWSAAQRFSRIDDQLEIAAKQDSDMKKDISQIMHELRHRYGSYFLNPAYVKERVSFVSGSDACMVAEDHPIVSHPKMVRLAEMGQVTLGGEQWLWFTTRGTREALMFKYGIYCPESV